MTEYEYKRFRDASIEATENMYRQMANDTEARGETKGKDEEKVATARKMKQCNESIDKIKLYTGLSTEKIKSLSV